ncbi:hypothetical protein [Actinocrispum wychmicini]|uniref:Uncharacterized protein n=1 Tax=Actinocrispum wychmicini TaxID=1213861 RepID=A0A4V2S665_9PSEU|nr:hypothetical protein [Actinocrispum wychmicini]TCO54780.1 hypothetical protein EV192_10868 [Actinocrispum wychmicini]
MRPLWIYLAAAAVVVALAVVLLAKLSEPELIQIGAPSNRAVTIAGTLDIDPAAPAAGNTVTVRATISTDRRITLRRLTVKVRDEAGTYHDFPERTNIQLDTTPRQVEWTGRFDQPGTYRYYLAYQLDADWVSLPPFEEITVR